MRARWLWLGVALTPLMVGGITGLASVLQDCDWDFDAGTTVYIAELLLLPLLVGGWGALAGVVSLRDRGAVLKILGAIGGCVVGLVWAPFALIAVLATFAEAGC